MHIIETKIPGVLILEPTVYSDARGDFFECFHAEKYPHQGLPAKFVQDNFSRSKKNVVRGLHYQLTNAQGKLIWITQGKIFDVVADVRRGSPTFGQWLGITLSADKQQQVYIPPGLAHGFCALTDNVNFYYKCTDYYQPNSERGILWSDTDLNIPWPVTNPILSDKDKLNPTLKDINPEQLPQYEHK